MRIFIIFIFLLSLFNSTFAQRAYFDKEKITVGDHCILTIIINKDKGKKIVFPVFENNITEGLEIIDKTNVIPCDNGKSLKQEYTVTSFDDSLFIIPPFKIIVDNNIMETNALKLEVINFIPDSAFLSKIDTSQQIPLADIKKPMDTPMTFNEFMSRFWFIFLILIIGGLLFWLYKYVNKRKKTIKNEPVVEPLIIISAHEVAIKQLYELKLSGKHKEKDLNPFYIALSKIIREYIEIRFDIPALESATFEIMREFQKTPYSEFDINNKLRELLSLSDSVKFAKDNPDENINELMFEYAYAFVNYTKQITEQTEGVEINKEV